MRLPKCLLDLIKIRRNYKKEIVTTENVGIKTKYININKIIKEELNSFEIEIGTNSQITFQ